MFWQNSGNVQISDVTTTKILIRFLIHQNKNNGTIFNDFFAFSAFTLLGGTKCI